MFYAPGARILAGKWREGVTPFWRGLVFRGAPEPPWYFAAHALLIDESRAARDADDGIGLGHRRLAIIDLNSGQQPMYRQDRQLVLVFNSEIYNYVELRDELQRLGHRFATQPDSRACRPIGRRTLRAPPEAAPHCETRARPGWLCSFEASNQKDRGCRPRDRRLHR